MHVPELKFCGLTRPEDAAMAAELGAMYAGAVFAGGPRVLDARRAHAMFAGLDGTPVRRVGVFAADAVGTILEIAHIAQLHVLQLHGGATVDRLLSLRNRFGGDIWAVVRVHGSVLDPVDDALVTAVDAVVLDTAVNGRAGGTGVAFDWRRTAEAVRSMAERRRVVLAGGLRPGNVAEAARHLAPSVVDVSSGVEVSPGIKDHGLMRAFATAARLCEG